MKILWIFFIVLMKRMMKIKYNVFFVFLILLFLVSGIFSLYFDLTSFSIERDWYEHTKAICFGNECQDFLIKCSGNEVIEISLISGKIVFEDDWQDKRENKELC